MKLENAIKKLSKFGKVENVGSLYFAKINNSIVEFMRNGSIDAGYNITCIRMRLASDCDDSMTDYCAGTWCKTLTQAIKMASN